jgi:endonuclease/exonuclease/phosphatase family metal-dependent hydrolase
VPRRSIRLAALTHCRDPKPELQAKKVLLRKWRPATDLPDYTYSDKFHRAFREPLKEAFLTELEGLATSCVGSWLICGDFNLIYQAQDKNNDRLNRRLMQRFRHTIDTLQLAELHLNGRLFTWSNERSRPTLERIDRVFATVQWLEDLHCRSTDCSDHAPLLLVRVVLAYC